MPLSKQRKAALDAQTLQFNKWCERVLEAVYKEYPRANVSFKSLMNLYASDVYYKMAVKYYLIREHRKGG